MREIIDESFHMLTVIVDRRIIWINKSLLENAYEKMIHIASLKQALPED